MSKGMFQTTIREIRGSLGRYMAILAIVMLGVGLFTGLKATTPAMIITENEYLAEQDFFDFRVFDIFGYPGHISNQRGLGIRGRGTGLSLINYDINHRNFISSLWK